MKNQAAALEIFVSAARVDDNRKLIGKGAALLITALAKFIDENHRADVEIGYTDCLMICHNFYRSIVRDIAGQSGQEELEWLDIAIATMKVSRERLADKRKNETDPNKH